MHTTGLARPGGGGGGGNTAASSGGGGGGGPPVELEEEPPALLTSLLTSRPWRSTSDQLAALTLGCCRTLAVAGGHPALLESLARVGRAAAAAAGGGGGGRAAAPSTLSSGRDGNGRAASAAIGGAVTVQRLMVRRQPGLDESLLRQLICGLAGLQVLGVAGCAGLGWRDAMQARRAAEVEAEVVGTGTMSLGWASEA
ncbi:hypothetical protein PLESTM_000482000 [Pleodorina starrii]|nr:hypothetical protein PLESTM_000482000 [Pleodorina starrii]